MNLFFPLKILLVLHSQLQCRFHPFYVRALFKANGASIGKNLQAHGIPRIEIRRSGFCSIGDNFTVNSYGYSGLTGENRPSKIIVQGHGCVVIGNNVGMSSTSIICRSRIEIADCVKIGGGVMIMDTDFHAIDPVLRESSLDAEKAAIAPVKIGRNVFIGAASIILKGVTIGENSVIGAGSVVAKSVPANQIWVGNPARFVRDIS